MNNFKECAISVQAAYTSEISTFKQGKLRLNDCISADTQLWNVAF